MIIGHGDDVYRTNRTIVANFSTNVWYGANMDIIREVILQQIDKINHYPEPDARSLVEAIAAHHHVQSTNVIAGNGATELFYLVAHAFCGLREHMSSRPGEETVTLLPVPSFREYEDACRLYKHRIMYPSFQIFQQMIQRNESPSFIPDLCFICNPNNPDGRIWTVETIRKILHSFRNMTLVVDESFIDFAPSAKSVANWIAECKNLLVIRSMTKNFAIPGLRLGYLLGHEELIAHIRKYTQPWSVNALAIEVGKHLLCQGEALLPDTAALLSRKETFTIAMKAVPGYTPLPSATSFFLVRSEYYEASELKNILLERYGLLIRDASNFRGLDKHYFRLNTLTEEKNNLLLKAMEELNEERITQ